MNENAQPADDPSRKRGNNTRRYWVDEYGNAHGVVITMRVDYFIQFTDQAIDLTPGAPTPDTPTA